MWTTRCGRISFARATHMPGHRDPVAGVPGAGGWGRAAGTDNVAGEGGRAAGGDPDTAGLFPVGDGADGDAAGSGGGTDLCRGRGAGGVGGDAGGGIAEGGG